MVELQLDVSTTNLTNLKILFEILRAIVQIGALIIAGIWTYSLFIKQRKGVPRINITPIISHFRTGDKTFISVKIKIENVGAVPLKLECAKIALNEIFPYPEEISELVNSNFDPLPEGELERAWSPISKRKKNWEKAKEKFEIEPGESDIISTFFIVDHTIQIVELNGFIPNPHKKNKELGWRIHEIYRINSDALASGH